MGLHTHFITQEGLNATVFSKCSVLFSRQEYVADFCILQRQISHLHLADCPLPLNS